MASFAMMAQNMANVKSPSTKSPSAKSPSAKPPSTKSKSAKSSVKSVPRGTPPGRSRNVALAWIAGVVVLAVVAAFVAVYLTKGSPKPAAHSTAAPSDIVQAATHVPPATLAAVGLGSGTSAPRPIKGAPQLTLGGLPQVVYVGAEYCPYCAAQRWAMVVALSRFGTFSNLGVTESSTSDNPPALQTLTFYGSHYSSPYLAFTPIENQTNQPLASGAAYAPLQPVTPFERQLVQTYDASTYTGLPASQDGAIPFVDFANRYLTAGASYPATTQGQYRRKSGRPVQSDRPAGRRGGQSAHRRPLRGDGQSTRRGVRHADHHQGGGGSRQHHWQRRGLQHPGRRFQHPGRRFQHPGRRFQPPGWLQPSRLGRMIPPGSDG